MKQYTDHNRNFVSYGQYLGPIYPEHQRQCCDNFAMMLVILFSLKTMESLKNGLQSHSGVPPLFSMRRVSLLRHRSVEADPWCKPALTVSWMAGSQNNLEEHFTSVWWSPPQAFFLFRLFSLLSSSFFLEGLFIDALSAIVPSSNVSFSTCSGSFSLTVIQCTTPFGFSMLSSNSFYFCTVNNGCS